MENSGSPPHERRRLDRSQGLPLRRRHGQLIRMLLERRHAHPPGFDVSGALELYLDRFPTREAQLVLLRAWLYAAERGELTSGDDYAGVIARAIDVVQVAPDSATAIAMLQRRPRE